MYHIIPLKADLVRTRSEKININIEFSLHQSSEYLDASQAVPRDPGISGIVATGRQIRKPAELHRECRRPVFNPRRSSNLRNVHDHPIPSMYALYLGYLGVINCNHTQCWEGPRRISWGKHGSWILWHTWHTKGETRRENSKRCPRIVELEAPKVCFESFQPRLSRGESYIFKTGQNVQSSKM